VSGVALFLVELGVAEPLPVDDALDVGAFEHLLLEQRRRQRVEQRPMLDDDGQRAAPSEVGQVLLLVVDEAPRRVRPSSRRQGGAET
jgi:hypothetical protein